MPRQGAETRRGRRGPVVEHGPEIGSRKRESSRGKTARGSCARRQVDSGVLSRPGLCGGVSDDDEVAQERVGSRAAPRRAGCAGWTVSSPPAAHRVRTPGAHTGCAHRVRTPGAHTGCAHRVRTPGAHTGCAHRVRTPYATGVLDTPGKPDVTGANAPARGGSRPRARRVVASQKHRCGEWAVAEFRN